MHYPHHQSTNANALDHFIVLQYPSKFSCNYFISFISFMQYPMDTLTTEYPTQFRHALPSSK